MQFMTILIALAATVLPTALSQSVTVSYDQAYDVSSTSLGNVACSDGSNGLETKGFSTFGSLPDFPNIGGAYVITGWNSAYCGTCWELSYNGSTVTVMAMDVAKEGYNLSLEAMNTLTNGQAQSLGRVDATATQVDASQCGL
ncbi:immunomodulatory protein [Amylocystis lapponica]|nr:immunomodulatory protein [Amylocystis lapponica]